MSKLERSVSWLLLVAIWSLISPCSSTQDVALEEEALLHVETDVDSVKISDAKHFVNATKNLDDKELDGEEGYVKNAEGQIQREENNTETLQSTRTPVKKFNFTRFYLEEGFKNKAYSVAILAPNFDIDVAEKDCEEQGGHLLEVSDHEELVFVSYSVGKLRVRSGSFYTGANDINSEGTFLNKLSGTQMKYTDWYPDQPSNYNHRDCVLVLKRIAKMYDGDCSFRDTPHVCELPALVKKLKLV